MKRKMFSLVIVVTGITIASCTYSPYEAPEVIVPTEPISYAAQIQPIFNSKCTSCHPSSGSLDLTEGNSYTSLMSKTGRVDTSNPPASLIVTKPASTGTHSAKYNTQEELLVLTWVEEGAKNN